jgi:hypothetical protein
MSRWYIIHAYSGFENKVKEHILSDAARLGLESQVEEVEVPTEKVTEIRRGKKVQSERKFFPGYVLAKLKHERRGLSPGQEHAQGHRLPGPQRQAAGDQRGGSRANPVDQGRNGRRRAEQEGPGRLRHRRQREGAGRSVRKLQRHWSRSSISTAAG